jgi:hypothetical protein
MSRMHLAVYIQPFGLHPHLWASFLDVKFHDSSWGLDTDSGTVIREPAGADQAKPPDNSDYPAKLIPSKAVCPIRESSALPSQQECDDPSHLAEVNCQKPLGKYLEIQISDFLADWVC